MSKMAEKSLRISLKLSFFVRKRGIDFFMLYVIYYCIRELYQKFINEEYDVKVV